MTKFGSAKVRSDKCVHSGLKGTDWIGRSPVTRGKMTADKLMFLVGSSLGETLTLANEWEEKLCERPVWCFGESIEDKDFVPISPKQMMQKMQSREVLEPQLSYHLDRVLILDMS